MSNVSKLAKFFDGEINSEIKELVVTDDSKGTYTFYGKYLIKMFPGGQYKAVVLDTKEIAEFSVLKNAVSWCTLHNAKLYKEARRLAYLDLKLSSLRVDTAIHRQLLKNATNSDGKLLYAIKVQEDTHRHRQVVQEINTYINNSKSIQASKFAKTKQPNFRYL